MDETGVLIGLSSLLVLSLGVYLVKLSHYKDNERGQRILGCASSWMFIGFILGFGLLLIGLNIFGLSRGKFVLALLGYGTLVSVLNAAGLIYYGRKFSGKK